MTTGAQATPQEHHPCNLPVDPDLIIRGCSHIIEQPTRIDLKFIAVVYTKRGIAYGKKGDLDRAITDFGEALRLAPKLADAYISRGLVYAQKGDLDRAVADCDQAISLNPKLVAAYFSRGIAFSKKGDLDRALADLDEALRLDPKLADAYFYRALTYAQMNDPNRAQADYEHAISLNPTGSPASTQRQHFEALVQCREPSEKGALSQCRPGTR